MSIVAKIVFGVCLLIYLYLGTVKIPAGVAASFNDLIAHAIAYAVLIVVAVFAFPNRKWFIRLAIFCFAYSILIECIQYFLPYRSLSLADIVANGMGILVGLFIAYRFWPLIQRVHQLPD